jgi:phenylalanyl-tRNA synthetase beta chain
MLMITDTAGSIAIAGVMGGQESEVSEHTVNVLLEAATFEGINNRRTAAQLRLPSEASYRFARGVPATLNPLAARHAAELMRQYAGGRIVPGLVDAYPISQPQPVVYTTVSDMERLLGMTITVEQIVNALQRLDFTVQTVAAVRSDAPAAATFALHRDPDEMLVEAIPPWHRLDIAIPADLTEEVARIIGYEHVGTTLINDVLPVQRRNELFRTEEAVRDILMGLGLQENINHPLTTPENHAKLNAPGLVNAPNGQPTTYVTVANPSMPEKRAMRRTMLVSVLENLARNLRYTDRLLTFEVGRVYLPEQGDGVLPFEDRRVSLCITGPRRIASFQTANATDEAMDFFDLKGIVETLLHRLGFGGDRVEYRAQPESGVFSPRCAEVFVDGQSIGLIGELHPAVRNAFGVPAVRIAAAELRLLPLIKPHWELQPMQPISTYPPVVEDLAFEVSEAVTTQDVQQAIRQGADARLAAVELFDIYRGVPLAAGNKSMAYRLTYQSPERSLNEKEVAQLRQRIIKTVEAQTGGKLRG